MSIFIVESTSRDRVEIGIYFPDPKYWEGGEESLERSAAFKRELEEEYGLPFHYDDIAPGFSYESFTTTLVEYWPVAGAFALFFAGEKIEKGADGWVRLYKRVKAFLTRPVYFNRDGAAVLAVNAVIEAFGSVPQSLTMSGYSAWSILEGEITYDTTRVVGIAEPPIVNRLGVVIHIFQIAADHRLFKVYVEGRTIRIIEMVTEQ